MSSKRMLAWMISHNAHGSAMDSLCFLPEGDEPETKANWRRVEWLDQPGPGEAGTVLALDFALRNGMGPDQYAQLTKPYYDHVSDCDGCPYMFPGRNEEVCTHGDAPDDDGRSPILTRREGPPPDWCPLRTRPTLVVLG